MKLCITARGPDLESAFEPHFARAPWFIFYDTRTRRFDAVRNGFVVNDAKMGRNTVELLVLHHIATVITGKTGPRARNLLTDASILLHICEKEGPVNEVLHEFLQALPQKPERGSQKQAPPG